MAGPKRSQPGIAELDNGVYVCGGQTADDGNSATLSTCVRYSVWSGRWNDSVVAPMPSPRYDFAIAAAGGRLYALGGITQPYQPGSYLFDEYDPVANNWTSLSLEHSLKVPILKPSMTAFGDDLYMVAFDGRTKRTLPTPYQYATKLATWRALQPLNPPRAGVALIVDEERGLLYAMSGTHQLGIESISKIERCTITHNEQTPWEGSYYQLQRLLNPNTWPTMVPVTGVKVEDRLYLALRPQGSFGRQEPAGAVEYLNANDGATLRKGASFRRLPQPLGTTIQISGAVMIGSRVVVRLWFVYMGPI